ncbi:23S rRNA (uracil(1939)-C(5))-methyltransferase RlmD [Dorea formicigenerans]|uniref:23S rRNA (uracil(1939)-C(5))-methyltransferase RlmD n=1 Tax=Dorea formicigenerans TaxID=39486 RepID=UPI00156F78E7|nr:23S rRNA (uracil(1939)-C(5))-methyltransferase RlmD [Dorea formicigenerans]
MQKNDLVTVAIEDIGVGGEGIGKVDGYTLFIKDAIIGDVVEAKIVKAKKNYGYARLMNIVMPSENRVEKPACPMARRCGGCQIQEMKYGAQLAFKEGKVRGNLERIGEVPTELLDKVMQPIVGMEEPFHYRNKAQFPIGTDKEGHIITGFYAGRTHSIIPNTDCALGVAVNQKILEIILHFMENNHISAYDEEKHKGLVRHVLIRYGFKTDEIMVCLVMNGEKLPHAEKLVDKLCKIPGMTSITISVNKAKTNVIMGNEIKLLWGQTYITDYIGNVKYQISPLSFYQVNPVQTEKLYGLALDYADLNGNETVWDLYCGIGTISLFLAQKAKQVYGVEIVPQAIDDARINAKINDITNAEFYVGKAEEVLPEYYREYQESHGGETAHADVIVVDPPRKGCEESLLQTIVDMQPEKVVYVSCDSATLARDVKFLRESGYELKKITPVDQFPNTVHVETVVLLSKGKVDSKKIRVEFSLEDMDMSEFQDGATYPQIKEYVLEHTGLKVSNLYISQIKRKCGIEVGKNYNLPKSEDSRQPQCPPEKEKAIREAFNYFGMI